VSRRTGKKEPKSWADKLESTVAETTTEEIATKADADVLAGLAESSPILKDFSEGLLRRQLMSQQVKIKKLERQLALAQVQIADLELAQLYREEADIIPKPPL
jgi:hypothetical protein